MRFLVDAQLPRRLCHRLREHGHDAVHTLDLPQANRTPDAVMNELSVADERVVVTKDSDFVDSLIVRGVPHKLLLVSTGTIRNNELEDLLIQNLDAVVAGFETHVSSRSTGRPFTSTIDVGPVALRLKRQSLRAPSASPAARVGWR